MRYFRSTIPLIEMAAEVMGHRDPNDVPTLAVALKYDWPVESRYEVMFPQIENFRLSVRGRVFPKIMQNHLRLADREVPHRPPTFQHVKLQFPFFNVNIVYIRDLKCFLQSKSAEFRSKEI